MLTPVDESGRFYPEYGWLAGRSAHDAADDIIADLRDARPPRRRRHDHATATPSAGAATRPLIFRISDDWFIARRRDPRADARGQPHGRVDARVHGQADGRLARQHVRLEHLAAPLLRPAAPLLPVLVRAPHRRSAPARSSPSWPPGRSTGSRSCAGRGSTTCVIRCPRVRRGRAPHHRGRRRVARRGHRAVLHARLGEPRVDRRGLRHRRRQGAHHRRPPRPRRTGRSGSRPTGCRRCASRSGCGSTPSSSCRWRSPAGRRTARCSATRRCSTRPAGRCTARGAT